MSVLPIVDRELRVASRRWSTFLIRSGLGLLAGLLSVPALLLGWMSGGGSGAGQGAFVLLANYLFVVAVLGGLLLTADCLSSEKREGTLGLLFLTDLRGYDVVLGKFAALGLHSIYGMVAVLPVLGLPLLIGGVTGGEFWRVSLALLSVLFVSLSAGMMISALSRQASRAFSGTLLLLLGLVAGLPLGGRLSVALGGPAWLAHLSWIGPAHAFSVGQTASSTALSREYWLSLGFSHALGWAFLIVAAAVAPVSWQDREQPRDRSRFASRFFGGPLARLFRARRSADWLDRDPMLWLMGERPALKILLWSVAGASCLMVILVCSMMPAGQSTGIVFGWNIVVLLIFGLALVEHTCRFWVEARQNGNLEALLALPLQSKQILASHWACIRRHFLWPLVLVLCATTLPTWIQVGSGLLRRDVQGGHVMNNLFLYAYMGGFLVWCVATFVAIGYTGLWLALKLRRPQFASGLTLLCVVLLPFVLCWLGFGVTLLFIFLPMSLLQSNLRGMILQRYVTAAKGR